GRRIFRRSRRLRRRPRAQGAAPPARGCDALAPFSPRSGLLRSQGLVASEQESVSPPPLVDDDVLGARRLELAPQARGVRVDGAGPDPGRADPPHVAEELRFREDTPRVARQLRGELELAPCEPHRRVADTNLPGAMVDAERPP